MERGLGGEYEGEERELGGESEGKEVERRHAGERAGWRVREAVFRV